MYINEAKVVPILVQLAGSSWKEVEIDAPLDFCCSACLSI